MKKDAILNFKSLLTIKEKIIFNIKSNFYKKEKTIKINNSLFIKERNDFAITKVFKEYFPLKTINSFIGNKNKILIKHSVFNFYINKYKLINKYLIENIEEFYRCTKVFIEMFNKKYGSSYFFEIEINHDVIFTILQYNENKIKSIDEYKKEKIENIFNEELFNIIRRL